VLFRFVLGRRLRGANCWSRRASRPTGPGRLDGGHAAMDMSVQRSGSFARDCSPARFTSVSHVFVMEWAAIWRDL